jgi:cysteine desulfurase
VYGWEAQEAVEEARSVVAELINADPSEIFWTSGATEADNLALKGICSDSQTKKHLITSSLEHKAILDCCRYLERQGHQIDYVQPNKHGTLTSAEIANVIEEGLSSVVSVMHVNNELGNINPIGDIGSLCREKGVLFHTDAAQSFGKLRIDVKEQCLDMISVSGHKIYGPKGVGFIFISKAVQKQIMPQLHGGGQEMSMRPGTLATHQIVGLSEAAKLMSSRQSVELQRLQALKRVFFDNISKLPGFFQNSHSEDHFPGILILASLEAMVKLCY